MKEPVRFALHLGIAAATLALAIWLPIPDPAGRFLKYGAYPALIGLILIFSLLYSSFRPWSSYPAIAATTAVVGITLGWLWRGDYADWGVIGGLLPISDASIYTMDAQRLLLGANFSPVSSYRTLANGFLSVLLASGHFQVALVVLALLASLALFALAVEVADARGPLAAGICLGFLFFFTRTYIGKALTETLGVTLSAFAFAFLIRGARKKDQPMVLCGLGILAVAMNVRAGALLVIARVADLGHAHFPQSPPGQLPLPGRRHPGDRFHLRTEQPAVASDRLSRKSAVCEFRRFALRPGLRIQGVALYPGGASRCDGRREVPLRTSVGPIAPAAAGQRHLASLPGFLEPKFLQRVFVPESPRWRGRKLYLGVPGRAKGWLYAPLFLLAAGGLIECIRKRGGARGSL